MKFPKFVRVCDVTFYMKSGNKIEAKAVGSQFMIQYNSEKILAVQKFRQYSKDKFMIESIDLEQIEGISCKKYRYILTLS